MRRVLFHLALVGFLCRALVPAGFMPAPLSDGGLIRVCHGGATSALIAALVDGRGAVRGDHGHVELAAAALEASVHSSDANAAEAFAAPVDPVSARQSTDDAAHWAIDARQIADLGDHRDAHDAAHEHWERCPVGAAFAFALLVGEPPTVLPAQPPSFRPVEPVTLAGRLLAASYHARAPPIV